MQGFAGWHRHRGLPFVVMMSILLGCDLSPLSVADSGFACATEADCGARLRCVDGLCRAPGECASVETSCFDAVDDDCNGLTDCRDPACGCGETMRDAGVTDAGATDAGRIDAGLADAGRIDAGLADAGRIDAGLADAGRTDAGSADAGRTDAGSADAGRTDAGSADAGRTDAGCLLPDLLSGVGSFNDLNGWFPFGTDPTLLPNGRTGLGLRLCRAASSAAGYFGLQPSRRLRPADAGQYLLQVWTRRDPTQPPVAALEFRAGGIDDGGQSTRLGTLALPELVDAYQCSEFVVVLTAPETELDSYLALESTGCALVDDLQMFTIAIGSSFPSACTCAGR